MTMEPSVTANRPNLPADFKPVIPKFLVMIFLGLFVASEMISSLVYLTSWDLLYDIYNPLVFEIISKLSGIFLIITAMMTLCRGNGLAFTGAIISCAFALINLLISTIIHSRGYYSMEFGLGFLSSLSIFSSFSSFVGLLLMGCGLAKAPYHYMRLTGRIVLWCSGINLVLFIAQIILNITSFSAYSYYDYMQIIAVAFLVIPVLTELMMMTFLAVYSTARPTAARLPK